MSELKSAWEIAQERAHRLGRLSPEEQEQQEGQRCRQIGQALAQKHLDSPQRWDITAELGKHENNERDLIKQGVIEHLLKAIEFTPARGMGSVKSVVLTISSLAPDLHSEAEEISQLIQEYEEAEQKTRQEVESRHRETLHQLRISGTAVDATNIEANPGWQLARQKLVEEFSPRLDALKKKGIKPILP